MPFCTGTDAFWDCCLLWNDEAKANIKPIYECPCNCILQTKRFSGIAFHWGTLFCFMKSHEISWKRCISWTSFHVSLMKYQSHFISFHFIRSWRPYTSFHFISFSGEMSIWWVLMKWVRESCLFIFWRHRRAGEERELCIETNKHARLRSHRQYRGSQLLLFQELPLDHVQ
jgi:hypothetical protein